MANPFEAQVDGYLTVEARDRRTARQAIDRAVDAIDDALRNLSFENDAHVIFSVEAEGGRYTLEEL